MTAAPRFRALIIALVLNGSIAGCGSTDADRSHPAGTAPASTATANTAAPASAPSLARPRIVILGDSLTAGLGLQQDEAYPVLLQQKLDREHLSYEVVNAGVSGDTSAGGLSRLDWSLDGDVRVLVVALGGNDGLRGLPAEELSRNLAAIIERARARHIKVVLAGMEAPPNFGQSYIVSFHRVYPDLAKKYGVPLVPFLLDGVAGSETLNQRDGIHPTAEGARIVAENVWKVLLPLLKDS